jgi:hypothetical protein
MSTFDLIWGTAEVVKCLFARSGARRLDDRR